MDFNILNLLAAFECDEKQLVNYFNGRIDISFTENIRGNL